MRVLFPINTKLNVNQLNLEVEVPQKIPKVGKMLVMKKKRTLGTLHQFFENLNLPIKCAELIPMCRA